MYPRWRPLCKPADENEVKANNVKDYGKHATQIMCKSTTQLGCAEAICKTGSWYNFYLVCQYNPA